MLARSVLVLLLSLSIFHPAPTVSETIEPGGGSFLRDEDHRVATATYRLATRGVRFCQQTAPASGLTLHQLGEYAPADRDAAIARFGFDEGPGILSVISGSPAERAGLIAGDVLISANDVPFPFAREIAGEKDEKKRRRLMEAVESRLDEQLRQGTVALLVRRSGRLLSMRLDSVAGCPGKGRLARSSQANAFADGRYAVMTTRMLAFVRNDDELAVAMAHEMAHNILGHPAQLDAQKVPHGILRGVGKNAARVRETEEEADRLGLKLLWAADYDVEAALPFWRRLYATFDPLPVPKFLRTHPSLAARERMIEAVLRELRGSP